MSNGLLPLNSNMQTAIETQERLTGVSQHWNDVVKNNIAEVKEYCKSLEYLTDDVLARVNIQSKTQADAINSTIAMLFFTTSFQC